MCPRGPTDVDVPFNLRVLFAELPHHLGQSLVAIDRLLVLIESLPLCSSSDSAASASSAKALPLRVAPTLLSAEAEAAVEHSPSLDERVRDLRLRVVSLYLHVGDYSTALRFLLSMVVDAPDDVTLLNYLGRVYLQVRKK